MQAFRLNGSRVLEINLAGDAVRAATGAMIAYTGDVSFRNAGMGGGDGLRGASSGQGLFTTTVSGVGSVALLSAGGPPIALRVTPQFPLVVDPDAFIASQGRLDQTFVTDVSWRNLIGESSGEAFSLRFDGHGVVYIQPEER